MSWDSYSGKSTTKQLRERAPLIAVGALLIVALLGTTFIASGGKTNDSVVTPTTATQTGETSTATPTQQQSGVSSAAPQTTTTVFYSSAPDSVEIRANAVNFVRAWARPDTPAAQWLDGLTPYLAATAIDNYRNVNTANIPASAVIGEPKIERDENDVFTVLVPTDTRTMRVVLNRQAKVTYIEPA